MAKERGHAEVVALLEQADRGEAGTAAEEGVPPAVAAAADVPFGSREEMWCRQTNKVFKRAPTAEGQGDFASLKGDAVPEMDHTMHQVWVRAQDGDGGVLGMLMR